MLTGKAIEGMIQDLSKKHLPSRAGRGLGEKDGFISNHFAANAFYFSFAAGTKKVEANTVLVWFDQLAKARSQLGILSLRQVAFKHTILHPLPIRLENFVDFRATFVFRDVIGDDEVHKSFEF